MIDDMSLRPHAQLWAPAAEPTGVRAGKRFVGHAGECRDRLGAKLRRQAHEHVLCDPFLRCLLDELVLAHETSAQIVGAVLARRLGAGRVEAALHDLLLQVLAEDAQVLPAFEADLDAVTMRDPACRSALHALLHLKGFQALQLHRAAHSLWQRQRDGAALWLAGQTALALGVDIHPAVPVGHGVLLDHASGIVIGETATIDSDVCILHGVTLGATGKQRGDRHPKVRRGAVLGAGATVLGNIEIGAMSRVGAGSVVLAPVPPHATVAGVPATVVRRRDDDARARDRGVTTCAAA